MGFPGGSGGEASACTAEICLQYTRPGFSPWVGKILWRREWQPTPVFLPGRSHGQGAWWATVLWVQRVRCSLGAKPPALFMETKRGAGTCPGLPARWRLCWVRAPSLGLRERGLGSRGTEGKGIASAGPVSRPPAEHTRCALCSHTFTHQAPGTWRRRLTEQSGFNICLERVPAPLPGSPGLAGGPGPPASCPTHPVSVPSPRSLAAQWECQWEGTEQR